MIISEPVISDHLRKQLTLYEESLKRWQAKINLVSPSTLPDIWSRHFIDSLQLVPLMPTTPSNLLDLGSGAGFPGMILSIATNHSVTLLESDKRKAAFLLEMTRLLDSTAKVIAKRIEEFPTDQLFDVITARALTDLSGLIGYANNLLKPTGFCVFPKGKTYNQEIAVAQSNWNFMIEQYPSLTDPSGMILKISHISRKPL